MDPVSGLCGKLNITYLCYKWNNKYNGIAEIFQAIILG